MLDLDIRIVVSLFDQKMDVVALVVVVVDVPYMDFAASEFL